MTLVPQGKRHTGVMITALADLLEEMRAEDAPADRELWR